MVKGMILSTGEAEARASKMAQQAKVLADKPDEVHYVQAQAQCKDQTNSCGLPSTSM